MCEYLREQTAQWESSLNRTLVEMLLEHFSAQEKNDSENAVLEHIVTAVRNELRQMPVFSLSQLFHPSTTESQPSNEEEKETEAIVEDFLENF